MNRYKAQINSIVCREETPDCALQRRHTPCMDTPSNSSTVIKNAPAIPRCRTYDRSSDKVLSLYAITVQLSVQMDRSGAAIRRRLHAAIAALLSRGGLGLVQRPPPHDGITRNLAPLLRREQHAHGQQRYAPYRRKERPTYHYFGG